MKNTKSLKNLVWYDYLTYFWLPLLAFLNFVALVLLTMEFIPLLIDVYLPDLGNDPAFTLLLFMWAYILLFLGLLPFIFTISVRRNLKKFTFRAPEFLSSWYKLPIWLCLGAFIITVLSPLREISPLLSIELIIIAFFVVRALVMVPVNSLYFRKRAALFGTHFVEEPVEEPEEYIPKHQLPAESEA